MRYSLRFSVSFLYRLCFNLRENAFAPIMFQAMKTAVAKEARVLRKRKRKRRQVGLRCLLSRPRLFWPALA